MAWMLEPHMGSPPEPQNPCPLPMHERQRVHPCDKGGYRQDRVRRGSELALPVKGVGRAMCCQLSRTGDCRLERGRRQLAGGLASHYVWNTSQKAVGQLPLKGLPVQRHIWLGMVGRASG